MNSHVPQILVLTPNTLSSVGMCKILREILPFAAVTICEDAERVASMEPTDIFHIFVWSQILIENISIFETLRHKSIVLTNGGHSAALNGYHQINIHQSEEQIRNAIKALHSHAHGTSHQAIMHQGEPPAKSDELLTPREIEVAKLLVDGCINKEIAQHLDIGITTVITHRKNIFEKLGIRSLPGLTIYAIMKRYIEI